MTKLCDLLGSRPEVMYECMYTKHKTQKRKTWQDGFISLYASRRLVVYVDDDGKPGKPIDEAKLAPFDWDRKDEEYLETSKFLVEVVNETPIGPTPSVQTTNVNTTSGNGFASANTVQQPVGQTPRAHVGPPVGLGGRLSIPKFRTPLSRGPPRLAKPGTGRVGYPYNRNATSAPATTIANPAFDFVRDPTSEWNYVPNAVSRTPDEVLVLLEK